MARSFQGLKSFVALEKLRAMGMDLIDRRKAAATDAAEAVAGYEHVCTTREAQYSQSTRAWDLRAVRKEAMWTMSTGNLVCRGIAWHEATQSRGPLRTCSATGSVDVSARSRSCGWARA